MESAEQKRYNMKLSQDMGQNLHNIKEIFNGCYDLMFRPFKINRGKTECTLVYIEGTVKKEEINDNILKPLMVNGGKLIPQQYHRVTDIIEYIKDSGASISDIQETEKMSDVVDKLMIGSCVLLVDGDDHALVIGVQGFEERKTGEAQIEPVLRGSPESFVESISINTAMLRKKIKTPNLKLEKLQLGRISKNKIILAYIKGIADDNVVNEIRQRLQKVDVDMLVGSGDLEPLVSDAPLSPFPVSESTERPDISAIALSEGRVVILIEGTPWVLIAPAVFSHFFVSAEDHYTHIYFVGFITMLRYIAFFIAMFGPSIFVAITTYHQEMIPAPLLKALMAARSDLPLPVFIEAVLMEITFELLREAGERLPRPIGGALSIVGAIVIGNAAIQSGLVSPVVVVVISVTATASFVNPKLSMSRAIRLIKLPLMVLAATLGIFGLIMGGMVVLIMMVSLRSAGVPYMSPFAPLKLKDIKSLAFRFPVWFSTTRPEAISKKNIQKVKSDAMPKPPSDEKE